MINEVLYCERLAYLEWIQREWADNHYTVDGKTIVHKRVDKKSAPRDPDDEAPWTARSIWLTDEKLGITAKLDYAESDGESVAVVEYKRGKKPNLEKGAWLPERAQLCAQVLLLRAHGYECNEAWIWFAKSKERVAIEIDDELIEQTLKAAERLRDLANEPLPAPLEDSPKCTGCSLVGICLPDELHMLRSERPRKPRQLIPSRDDLKPLYVQDPGARVGVRKEMLEIKLRNGSCGRVGLPRTSQVSVFGNVQLSTQAIRALLSRNVPISFFSSGGWYLGRTVSAGTKNVDLKRAQFVKASDEVFRLELAKSLVVNKIRNSRAFLRRNGKSLEVQLFELKGLARKASSARNRQSLLGLEGAAARVYFQALPKTLKGDDTLAVFDFERRSRRPPVDPFNAAIGFAYALLTKEWVLALACVGLDPDFGFYHESRHGKPALALDMMEPYRPLIADSAVVAAINTKALREEHFITSSIGCSLTKTGRRSLIKAFERRISQQIVHPVFGYKISYRRLLEVQARLLTRLLFEEIDSLPQVVSR